MAKISAVINTYNEEENIADVLKSVAFADEVIVCDMHSTDKTVEIAKKMGAKIYMHDWTGFVEPARNFAISKTVNDWILILDADERIEEKLSKKLKNIAEDGQAEVVRIPRKNIIFNKWIKYAKWWPDYQVRFFKKGQVTWKDKIHSVPEVIGKEMLLETEEELAIIHYNYENLSDYMEKMLRYTKAQSEELSKGGYEFDWKDLIKRPLNEFLGRFFVAEGYKDGLHGLSLSLLQAFSELILYLRIWEKEGFKEQDVNLKTLEKAVKESGKEIDFWINKSLGTGRLKKILKKFAR